jgi:tetratricopeptide (TPR) repeat protein
MLLAHFATWEKITLSTEKFFRKSDWIACWVTFVIALLVYTITLQPTVGLEDSGELIVASDYLGVPHPPGYPSWSLLTWLFQWIFHGVTFHGHPNPAWAVNFFSAFSGAAACGVIALLISRSGMDLLRSLSRESNLLGEKTESLFCCVAGISGGLLLAFAQGMWSQSVIAEVYSLNIFFQSLVLIFLYRWVSESGNSKWLLACAFVFGLGITNHQTLMFMGLAIAIAVVLNDIEIFKPKYLGWTLGAIAALVVAFIGIWFNSMTVLFLGVFGCIGLCLCIREPFLARDFIITGSMFLILVGMNKWATETAGYANLAWDTGPAAEDSWYKSGFWIWTLFALIVPLLATFTLPRGKIVGPTFLLIFIGLAFYFYMPISSDQNPPINWGYPRTWQGFMHAITRGQYEQVKLAHVFSAKFLQQVGTYLMDLRSQFYGPTALLAAIPFFFCWKVGRKNIAWLVTTLIAFLSVGIVFMILQNPKTDIQSLFIGRVQYIQSHAIYVIWLGYGILLLMAYLETLAKNNTATKTIGVALVLLLPFSLIYKNFFDKEQRKVYGGAEQGGHDFGWQFGNWQLQGVKGIEKDLRAWYSPEEFDEIWAEYPNKNYPEPMGPNAIFFGGTDPGRFVPTYMIYSAKVRQDVYLITQNALADHTYMNVMRDLYGDQIWIPSPLDSNMAFQMYMKNDGAGADVNGDRVQVQGVQAVMKINGYLSKMIFDHNQYRTETKTDEKTRPVGAAIVYDDPSFDPTTGLPPERTFYVEESYALPWMYPYLTPHGLIMKINSKPTPLTEEMIRNDTEFWDWYCARLLNDPKFMRDIVARKSFSKLRSSIAALYTARNRPVEAEAAFRQAIDLYDLSPESNYRLANLLTQLGRFDEAMTLFDSFLEKDENNEQAAGFLAQLKERKALTARQLLLEQKRRTGKLSFQETVQLASFYFSSGQIPRADALMLSCLKDEDCTPDTAIKIAQLMAQQRRFSVVYQALTKFTQLKPEDPIGWINLAALHLSMNKPAEMWKSIDRAIAAAPTQARTIIRQDARFNPIRKTQEYQTRVPSPKSSVDMGLMPSF